MIEVERDGAFVDLLHQWGLETLSLRLTLNEAYRLHEKLHLALFPPPPVLETAGAVGLMESDE